MRRHLTHTGQFAGLTYCGGERSGLDCHLPYGSVGDLIVFVETKISCDECKAVFHEHYIAVADEIEGIDNDN